MSNSASDRELQSLHAIVAAKLKEELNAKHTDEDGKVKPLSPQLLAQAIKFLKDNGIQPSTGANTAKLDALQKRVEDIAENDPDELRLMTQ